MHCALAYGVWSSPNPLRHVVQHGTKWRLIVEVAYIFAPESCLLLGSFFHGCNPTVESRLHFVFGNVQFFALSVPAGNMAFLDQPLEVVAFTIALLSLLLNTYEDLGAQALHLEDTRNEFDDDMNDVFADDDGVLDMPTITATTLHLYQLCNLLWVFKENFGY
jgi:hypothetical protein